MHYFSNKFEHTVLDILIPNPVEDVGSTSDPDFWFLVHILEICEFRALSNLSAS